MEESLYKELVDKLFITDVTLTLEDINAKQVKLEDIITQPAAYPYYAENTHFSAQYLLNQLKQKLPNQKWRRTYMYGAEVVHNHKEL